jgi:hypothetical protein
MTTNTKGRSTIGRQKLQPDGGIVAINPHNYHVVVAIAKARGTTIRAVVDEAVATYVRSQLA